MISMIVEHGLVPQLSSRVESLLIARNWIDEYITKPDEQVGRKGPVCPFVPRSIVAKKLFYVLSEVDGPHRDTAMRDTMAAKNLFAPLLGEGDSDDIYDCLIVLLPYLSNSEGGQALRTVHFSLKPAFVASKFMLGEFHKTMDNRGLHNIDFLSARSPVPLLVVRRMVPTDIAFLSEEDEPAERRLEYIRQYLFHLRTKISDEEARYAEKIMKDLLQ